MSGVRNEGTIADTGLHIRDGDSPLLALAKPCPECGHRSPASQGVRIVGDEILDGQRIRVACQMCGERGPLSLTLLGAIGAWNERAEAKATGGQP